MEDKFKQCRDRSKQDALVADILHYIDNFIVTDMARLDVARVLVACGIEIAKREHPTFTKSFYQTQYDVFAKKLGGEIFGRPDLYPTLDQIARRRKAYLESTDQ